MTGHNLARTGELASGLAHLEHVIGFYDPEEHHALAFAYGLDPAVYCLSWVSWTLWFLGYRDQALKRSQEALALGQELSYPPDQAFSQGVVGYFALIRRDVQRAQELIEACTRLSTEHGFAFWLAILPFMRGWLLVEQGCAEQGIVQMRQGMASWEAIGTQDTRSVMLGELAMAHARVDQVEEGASVLAEALAFVEKTGERFYEAELYRIQGELLRLQKDETRAEASFHQALAVARRQQARSWELRASLSLSRLWEARGKREEACRLLAGIYAWFTEGLDTPDLKEARARLQAASVNAAG